MHTVTEIEIKKSTIVRSNQGFQTISDFAFSNNNVFGRRIRPQFLCASRPRGAAYVPIVLSEVEQEQRPSENGDREAIVVGAGLCDSEGDSAYTIYDPVFGREKYLKLF